MILLLFFFFVDQVIAVEKRSVVCFEFNELIRIGVW